MADLPIAWSVIGHLQVDKAKHVARFAAGLKAIDSLKVAEALDRGLQIHGRSLDVLVESDSSGEATKHGLSPKEKTRTPSSAESPSSPRSRCADG